MKLSNSHWRDIRNQNFEIAILPWGATEAHNYHLPYGTDNFETEAIGLEAIKISNRQGARAVLLPCIPFGVNTGQSDIPLTLNLNPSTQAKILEDMLQAVRNAGIRKFLILNGHGGNDFKQILRELGNHFPDIFLATCNWFQAVDKKIFFENEGDHADEMETSLMLYLHPELVLPLDQAGKGESRKFTVKNLNEKWAWTERKWTRVSKDTGIGNPAKASLQKGEQYFKAVVEKVAGLITDISKTREENWYS